MSDFKSRRERPADVSVGGWSGSEAVVAVREVVSVCRRVERSG